MGKQTQDIQRLLIFTARESKGKRTKEEIISIVTSMSGAPRPTVRRAKRELLEILKVLK